MRTRMDIRREDWLALLWRTIGYVSHRFTFHIFSALSRVPIKMSQYSNFTKQDQPVGERLAHYIRDRDDGGLSRGVLPPAHALKLPLIQRWAYYRRLLRIFGIRPETSHTRCQHFR